ncbi:MAG: transcriptional regulator [Bacteroidetes bacterium RIFCSPHIGHO2_02_FULL_44_7]|nr:MAG: transcriptional regulator [Bacteroidetes bacterium RIFCSPHIGHO2_02_FULL_44_7]
MLNSRSIGNKIAEARKKMNFSQAELAQHVSISPQAVGKWERGESMPDITTLNRLAEIFGVDLNYFSDSFQTSELAPTSYEHVDQRTAEDAALKKKTRFNSNWDLSRGNWKDADFSGLKNLKEKFSSSNMKNCKFKHADLTGLILGNNNIELCDFTSSDLRDSKIQSSNLMNNQFNECSFIDAEFLKTNIEKCDFSKADFSGTEMLGVNFGKNIVKDTVWKFTLFKKSNLSHLVFEGILEDCHFELCGFYQVTFENATILNTFFKNNAKFKKVQFINCKADSISYAFLKNNQANLTGITLIA